MDEINSYIESKIRRFENFLDVVQETCLTDGLYNFSADNGESGYVVPEKKVQNKINELWLEAILASNHPGLNPKSHPKSNS